MMDYLPFNKNRLIVLLFLSLFYCGLGSLSSTLISSAADVLTPKLLRSAIFGCIRISAVFFGCYVYQVCLSPPWLFSILVSLATVSPVFLL